MMEIFQDVDPPGCRSLPHRGQWAKANVSLTADDMKSKDEAVFYPELLSCTSLLQPHERKIGKTGQERRL